MLYCNCARSLFLSLRFHEVHRMWRTRMPKCTQIGVNSNFCLRRNRSSIYCCAGHICMIYAHITELGAVNVFPRLLLFRFLRDDIISAICVNGILLA